MGISRRGRRKMISRLTPIILGVNQGKDGLQKERSTKKEAHMQNALQRELSHLRDCK